jgi:hypothetical protein
MKKEDFEYVKYILNKQHQYGQTENIKTLLSTDRKGRSLDMTEEFQICLESMQSKLIDEQNSECGNRLFDLAINIYTKQDQHMA